MASVTSEAWQTIDGDFPPSPESPEERIRRRAHEIWLEREGQSGSAIIDWLQAEEEILAQGRDERV
jgi:hypothetical protein